MYALVQGFIIGGQDISQDISIQWSRLEYWYILCPYVLFFFRTMSICTLSLHFTLYNWILYFHYCCVVFTDRKWCRSFHLPSHWASELEIML